MRGSKVKKLRKAFTAYAAANGKFPNESQKINRKLWRYPASHARFGRTFETHTIINPFKAAFRRLKKQQS
jgi:hypothetical protein